MKKGFTLLEMLAVLVMILVISSVVVLNFNIRTSRADEDAALANAKTYVKEANIYALKQDLKEEEQLVPATYSVNQINGSFASFNDLLNLDETNPDGGNITIDNQYQVSTAVLIYGDYQVVYDNGKYTITNLDK